ncbi:MAG: fibrobacter succinogenes major paralogous domain-containing protein [Candidatus Zixiibacteriota bacterium]
MKSITRVFFLVLVIGCVLSLICGCSDDNSPTTPNGSNGSSDTSSTVTDIDGNSYRTVTIGNQVWMAENLKVTHYRNGDLIPNVMIEDWSSLTTGARCSYNNDYGNSAVMGLLYNNYAVTDSRNIAPEGWRVPKDSDWQTMIGYLGGEHIAGAKMKEAGYDNWLEPNTGATNESGFTALPSGGLHHEDYFTGIGSYAYFWSSSLAVEGVFNDTVGSYLVLLYNSKNINRIYDAQRKHGQAVRCIKVDSL